MSKYQVQYKNNSKTFNDILEANSEIEIKSLFQDMINAEITEISEIVYINPTYPKDDGNYIKSVSALIKDDNNSIYSFKIPKLKKTISSQELEKIVSKHIKINNIKPKSVTLKYIF